MQKILSIDTAKIIPALIIGISLLAVFAIPNIIMKYGYIPNDDALYHVSKVISGKDWSQIIVMRGDVSLDPNLGWHTFLGLIRKIAELNSSGLLSFSVVFLFFLFCASPILIIRRPEAWLAALIVIGVMPWTEFFLFLRLLKGRPYIITMTAALLIGFLWPRLNDKKSYLKTAGIITAAIAAAAYLHCSWYLFAVPIACFLIARQWRAGIILALSAVTGVLIGSFLTGHPLTFLVQTIRHPFLVFGSNMAQIALVDELQADIAPTFAILAVLLMLIWRRSRSSRNLELSRDPMFIMMVICMALGCVAKRFWFDLGRPAFCVWTALEFQEYFESIMDKTSSKRILLTAVSAIVLVMLVATDTGYRWSHNRPPMVLSPDDPAIAGWMPEDGGILYSDSLQLFDEIFYRFPKAEWRYALGVEPGLMTPENLAIFRNIQLSRWAPASFAPWVNKMRPQDRLVLLSNSTDVRYIKGLEWYDTRRGVSIGRLPR